MAKQTIYVGYPEYTHAVSVTELRGEDISADPIVIGFSTVKQSPPTTWFTPDIFSHSTTNSLNDTATVQKLIDFSTTTLAAGTYFVWLKITDSPETPARYTGLQLDII